MLKTKQRIDFRPVTIEDKDAYEKLLFAESGRGCEFSFANIYLWGRQNIAFIHGHIVMFSQFDRRTVYPFPLGVGDKRAVLDAIIADSRDRGIPCRISGLSADAVNTLRDLYPDRFHFHCDRGSFDYVYDINDLADLKGRRYQKKRNHFNRFRANNPDYTVEPICEDNIERVEDMVAKWYNEKMIENPDGDYHMEHVALQKALRRYDELGMEALALLCGGEVLAVTMGSRLSADSFDVHFEKARSDADGAYAAINCEFARYIRAKYPDVAYLDREEDMGIEGLRRAKESYLPHHMIEKCWAHLLEEGYEY